MIQQSSKGLKFNDDLSEDFIREVDRILSTFKMDVLPIIYGNMRQVNIDATGKLRNSIDLIIDQKEDGWTLSFSMMQYGKTIHKSETWMRKVPVKALADWILQKGFQYFDFIPDYIEQNLNAKTAERMAWAMKIKSGYKYGRRRFKVRDSSISHKYASAGFGYNGFFSWFYKPYFGEWKNYRQEIVNAFYTTSSELMDEVVKTYKMTA